VLWTGEELGDGRLLHDFAGIKDRRPLAELGDDTQIVGDEEEGGAVASLHRGDQFEYLLLHGDIKRRRRFIGHDQAVFGAEDTLAGCLAVVKSVGGGLTLDRARAASAASGMMLATDVADYLVGKGMPFRRAHEVVGALVRKLVAEERDFDTLSLEEWRAASDLCEADVIARITPAVSVQAKRTPQSTAPDAVRARLADVRLWLDGLGNLC